MNKYTVCLLLLFYGTWYYGQKYDHPFHAKLPEIKAGLQHGNKNALKQLLDYTDNYDTVTDFLGHHWGQNTISGIAWRTFSEYYLFESWEQEELVDTNKTGFKKFMMDNFDRVGYSGLTQTFFLLPAEKRAVTFKLTEFNAFKTDDPITIFEAYKAELKDDLEYLDADDPDDINDALEKINDIARLTIPQAEAFIHSCFTATFFEAYKFPGRSKVYEVAAYALQYYPSLQNVNFIQKLADEKLIPQKQAVTALEKITNIPFEKVTFENNRYQQVVKYLEHFKTMEEMRLNGYEKRYHSISSEFKTKADYYGQMLILSDDESDLTGYRNALYDLISTNDPASLKYLAGIYYRHRLKWNDYHFYNEADPDPSKLIEKLTGTQLQVENEQHAFTSESEWGMARLNYFLYWNNHYKDYEWNDSLHYFVNMKTPVEKADVVTTYYHQLSSEIDSVIAHAFLMLAESDPAKVKELLMVSPGLIEDVDRKHYGALPTFPQKRLRALVDLTDYCKKQTISFKPDKNLAQQLDSLGKAGSQAALYRQEEYLINHIRPDQLTAVEYWAASGDESSTYSIGRMLDKLYTKHIDSLIKNEKQLRLFLKKATLFNRFGIIGVCNKYLWKLNNTPEAFKDLVKALLAKETDPDIILAINNLFQGTYWKSDCKGDVPPLYQHPINEVEILNKIGKMPSEKQGEEYSDLQYNVYFTDRIANRMLSPDQLKPMIRLLEKYAYNKKNSEYEFSRSLAFSYWLKNHHLPYALQFEKALELKQKDAYKDLTGMIILQGKYKDIPVLLDTYETENKDMNTWTIQSHIAEDLAIPINLGLKSDRDTLKNRYKRLSEKELYRSYLVDFGLGNIFLSNDSLDYNRIYHILEYDVVDAFVGGGGGRQSTSALLAVQVLEMHFNTLLGFHWRKEYLYANTANSFYRRSCTWMRYLRDKKLVLTPKYRPASFSN